MMGLPGCDNRLAHLLSETGYRLSNPCRSIRTIHLHRSNVRSYGKLGKAGAGAVQTADPYGTAAMRVRRSISSEYHEFDWFPLWQAGESTELRYQFVRLTPEFRPSLIFAQIQTANVLSSDELCQARCPSCPGVAN
jgi:hypothetical protein